MAGGNQSKCLYTTAVVVTSTSVLDATTAVVVASTAVVVAIIQATEDFL